jgi:hypothetical protein
MTAQVVHLNFFFFFFFLAQICGFEIAISIAMKVKIVYSGESTVDPEAE